MWVRWYPWWGTSDLTGFTADFTVTSLPLERIYPSVFLKAVCRALKLATNSSPPVVNDVLDSGTVAEMA